MREQQTKGKAGRDEAIRSRARERFLKALSTASSVTAAATAAGVSRMTVYRWQAANPAFAEAWRDAYEAGSDRIEDELQRRGHDGWDEPVFYKGEVVGAIRRFSDTLLLANMKARRPDKYRERGTVALGLSESLEALVLASLAPADAAIRR